MNTLSLELPVILPTGPECQRCTDRLREELSRIKGVSSAGVDNARKTLTVEFDPDIVTLSRIESEARNAGATITATIEHNTLELRDLDCPDCASTIEKSVRKLPGVIWAGANFAAGQMHAEYQRGQVRLEDISRVVESHGARACLIAPGKRESSTTQPLHGLASWISANRKLAATVAAGLLTVAAIAASRATPLSIGLYAAAIVIGGWTTARAAMMALRARSVDMNVLMSLAVFGAAAIGDWFEAATVVVLYNVGALLQTYTVDRTRRSIRALIDLSPNTALVRRDGIVEIPVDHLIPGDIVMVKPGERIPVDGEIVLGSSAVNESPITGESLPTEKGCGGHVFAGTLNGFGALEVRATHPFKETTLARIIHLVEEAQTKRAPAQEFIDRFAAGYTPTVVVLAIAIAILPPAITSLFHLHFALSNFHFAFLKALSLLIIACPCALVISTPVAIVTAIGSASRNGVLIKGGAFLERLGRIRALLYDKTRTLTQGRFEVDEIVSLNGTSEQDLMALAAAIESQSEHPLAAAIVNCNLAIDNGRLAREIDSFESVPGLGARARIDGQDYLIGSASLMESNGVRLNAIRARIDSLEANGRTTVILADDSRPLGIISLRDIPRPAAAGVIRELRAMDIHGQAILTGDNKYVAQAVARDTDLTDVRAALLPDQKMAIVREFQAVYGTVGMVGDGINDAPALAAADVGIVMGAAGSDTAIETADVALMGDDLTRLPYAIRLGRSANAVIRQNVAFALGSKAVLLIAAVTTGLPLWLAVVGDVGVSLAVTLNALRLLRTNPKPISVV